MFNFFKRLRRKKILASDFPDAWLDILRRNIWQFRFLHREHQQRVLDTVQVMADEKSWEGVDGFAISPEVIVTISGTASLLTLGLAEPYFFDRVRTIIVHPSTINNQLIQQGMIVDRDSQNFDGQAWQGGPVLFSWPAVVHGSRRSGDGRNVVIHEFAHHIDGLDGQMGGMPYIGSKPLRERWEQVFDRDYQQLVEDLRQHRPPAIDAYAGTSRAEFFAVSSELFFDAPHFLQRQLPDVYQCLAAFYQIDPLSYEVSE